MSDLPEEFPTPNCWSGIGKGWFPIVDALHKYLLSLDPGYQIDQIKEKFGTLRYYYSSDLAREDPVIYAKFEAANDVAVMISARTCEGCGRPGELRTEGWLKTLCDQHYAEQVQARARAVEELEEIKKMIWERSHEV